MEQISILWRGELEVVEEAGNPAHKDEQHGDNEERCSNTRHHGLEMTLILRSLDQICRLSDECVLCGRRNDRICLSAFASRSVMRYVAHVFVHGEGFTCYCRLITGDKWWAIVNGHLIVFFLRMLLAVFTALLSEVVRTLPLDCWVTVAELLFLSESLVLLKIEKLGNLTDQTTIAWDRLSFLDNNLCTTPR